MNKIAMVCGNCGVEYSITLALYDARQKDGETFYCPNGHGRVFRPTEDQRRIAQLEHDVKWRDEVIDDWRERWDELYAQREELIATVKECPGHCGWRSNRRIPRDPVQMGRGLERVRLDVAQHLVEVHGAQPAISEPRLLEAGS